MMSDSRTNLPMLFGLACLAGSVVALPAAAGEEHGIIRCGDVIFGSAQLERDLECKTDPALTVVGDLDLNGFRVVCLRHHDVAGEGVVLEGYGAILRNGFVEGCFRSVVLAGRGGHLVTQVTASGDDRAFSIESSRNRLIGNTASTTGNDAFRIEGARNLLSGNMVLKSGSDGFGVRGRHNVLPDNQVNDVAEEGFDLRDTYNEVVRNVIRNSGDDGVQVRAGYNLVSNNLIVSSAGRGILIGGFLTEEGPANDIIGNHVLDSGSQGIKVDEGFFEQRILNNTVLDNPLDLEDDNPDCDDNLWAGNIFATADPDSCIN